MVLFNIMFHIFVLIVSVFTVKNEGSKSSYAAHLGLIVIVSDAHREAPSFKGKQT